MDNLLPNSLIELSDKVVIENKNSKRMIATAESCTGGLVSAAIIEIAGSSSVLDCAFVTYSNAAKTRMLGVPEALLEEHGAVSLPIVEAMSKGAIQNSQADVAVSISGIAGPGGGTEDKPVGTVAFALADKNGLIRSNIKHFNSAASRSQIRLEAAIFALNWLRP